MKRKKSGLTQEAVAEKLGVSRQTISKWETDETLPDICQSKRMAQLYHVTLDEAAWGKKYPILVQYQNEVPTSDYAARLTELLDSLRNDYSYSKLYGNFLFLFQMEAVHQFMQTLGLV